MSKPRDASTPAGHVATQGAEALPSDDDLVALVRAGAPRAFDELVRRHRPRVVALALRMTRSAADADDIAQDTFTRAFRRLHRFEGRCQFSTWLHRIALNRALSRIADAQRRRALPLDERFVEPHVTSAVAEDPYGVYERHERRRSLLAALVHLSPSLRRTLLLVAVEGVTQRDAALVLGCRTGTVGWRLHQARTELRRRLRTTTEPPDAQPRSDIAT